MVGKLILPTLSNLDAVQCVAILKPESAFPGLKSLDLNLYFLNIPVKWLSIADLSYGTACMMEANFPFSICDYETEDPVVEDTLAIQLADGQFYALLPESSSLPTTRLFYFTTSKDSQTTASLQFSKKRLPCGKAVLEDLTPRVRGAARIKVVVQCDLLEHTRVTIQELGSSEKIVMALEDVQFSTSKPIKVMFGESKSLVLDNDGVVGELPE
ncbi:hypothetical protein CPB86DRAFT_782885 [Serendipita vermifera]|nr:hypothetical protein CPB86DRAFT_782885 [Serendipita vermifera]